MDITFELHTTIKDPFKIHVKSKNTLKEVHELILQAIEQKTIFTQLALDPGLKWPERQAHSLFSHLFTSRTVVN